MRTVELLLVCLPRWLETAVFDRLSTLRCCRRTPKVLNVLEEELPCVRYDGWGNLTPSGYFKFDLGVCPCTFLSPRFSESRPKGRSMWLVASQKK